MSFQQLQLIEPVLQALSKEGYTNPTPIQAQAIPVVLQGRDLLGCAQTGTGKTAAFAIPLLQLLHQNQGQGKGRVRALILTPTRELAIQIEESFKAYGRFLKLRCAVVFGGVSQYQQVQALRRGVDIVVATPGRLLDLLQQRHISLDHIQHFVLDEADRMLDMGFVQDVRRIISRLPEQKQTLLFSATMPGEIRQLVQVLLKEPVKVEVTPVSSTVEKVEQQLYYVEANNKRQLLAHLLENDTIPNVLVFARTKHGADRIARDLSKVGIPSMAIHGNKTQAARQQALTRFKQKKVRVLVATDIAARGIDIDELSYVINYDIPNTPETYVHRIGRTGRAGASGIAISFCDWSEKIFIRDIERLIKKQISLVKDHPFDVVNMHAVSRPSSNGSGSSSGSSRKVGGGKKYGRRFVQRA